ncbi:DUF6443 domain-containing protein [Ekhidna sp.]
MFKKILILLLASFSLSSSFSQGYEDHSITWSHQDWIYYYSPVSGGGSVRLDIVDNVLTVRFDASFQTAYVITTPFELNTTRQLPDMTLGQINGGYTIKIEDGKLRATGPQVAIGNFGNKTFTQELPHINISANKTGVCPDDPVTITRGSYYGITSIYDLKLEKSTWNGSSWTNFNYVDNPSPLDGSSIWAPKPTKRTRYRVKGDYAFNGGYSVYSNTIEVGVAKASLKMTYQGGTSTTFPDAPQGATVGFNLDLDSDYSLSSGPWVINGNHVASISSYTFDGKNPVTIKALVQSAALDCSFYTNDVTITPKPHIDIQVDKSFTCPGDQLRITRTSSYGTTDLWNLRLQKSIWNGSGWSNFTDVESPNPLDGGSIWNYSFEKRIRFRVIGEYAFELGYTVESNIVEVNSCNQIITRILRFRNFTENAPENLSNEHVSTFKQFYDGLGRLKQEVSVMQSPQESDFVIPHNYDGLGREAIQYLPYVDNQNLGKYRENAIQDQLAFYQTATDISNSSTPFSERRFENSPLNRALEQGSPGEAWQIGQATVSFEYLLNSVDEVIQWNHVNLLTNSESYYPENQLYKNQTTDEDGNITNEYVDKLGRTILKESFIDSDWAKTYYIYDDFGLLRVVIPPEATSKLNTDFFAANADRQAFLNTWAFQYTYDARKRMSEKKVPGADPIHMVYDKWDRLALTQDGVQHKNDRWLFTCYDALNRPVMTGILNDSRTRSELQASVGSIGSGDTYRFLSFIGTTTNHGYNQHAYPHNNTTGGVIDEVLSVTYYDNYEFKTLTNLSTANYVRPSEFEGANVDAFHILPVYNSKIKGLVTGTKTKVLDTDDYLTTITFYDDKYRAIQVVSENYVNGIDIISNQYDFTGSIREIKSEHSEAANSHTILIEYEYDHANRLLQCFHTHNNGDRIELYSNEYNQLGELITKNLHYSETDAAYMQQVDYEYNIRGWLRSINKASLSNSPEELGPTDLFSLELIYNTPIPSLPNN